MSENSEFKKSLIKISYLSLGNILNAGLGFLFILALARNLDVQDFGRYALLASLLVFMAKFIDFGTNPAFVAKSVKSSSHDLSAFLSAKVILLSASVILSLILLSALNLNSYFVVVVFILGLVFYSVNFTAYGLIHKNEDFLSLILLNFLPALIKGLVAILVLSEIVNITSYQAFSVFSLSVFSSVFVLPLLKDKFPSSLNFNEGFLLIKNSYTAGIAQVINDGWPAINNTIAKFAKGFNEVGIFSIADKLSDVFSLISISIFAVLLPKNAKVKNLKRKYNFKEITILSLGIISIAIISYIVASVIIQHFLGTKYFAAIPILGALVANSSISAITSFIDHYFYIEEKPNLLFQIYFIKLSCLIGLSLLLVPVYNLLGLAIANLVAAIISLIISLNFVKSFE